MTPEELDRLKDLCAKATPGPWDVVENIEEVEADEAWVYRIIDPASRASTYGEQRQEEAANCEFISASRIAIPALIAEVERLRKALEYSARESCTSFGECAMLSRREVGMICGPCNSRKALHEPEGGGK